MAINQQSHLCQTHLWGRHYAQANQTVWPSIFTPLAFPIVVTLHTTTKIPWWHHYMSLGNSTNIPNTMIKWHVMKQPHSACSNILLLSQTLTKTKQNSNRDVRFDGCDGRSKLLRWNSQPWWYNSKQSQGRVDAIFFSSFLGQHKLPLPHSNSCLPQCKIPRVP